VPRAGGWLKPAEFPTNGRVGGGTILFTAHYPRLHPSDFRVKLGWVGAELA
jgi:hypothetical protein